MLTAVLPLLAALFISRAMGGSLSITEVLSRGELLLVATTLAAAAAGELFGREHPSTRGVAEVYAGVVALLIAVLTALSYGAISHALSEGGQADAGFVTAYSIVMYGLSALAGAVCVVLAERGDPWDPDYNKPS
jgi:hypothetical protein